MHAREDFIYLGDTARLPYGTKSCGNGRAVILAMRCRAECGGRVRCLVVACNTASASALDALRLQHPRCRSSASSNGPRRRRSPLPFRNTSRHRDRRHDWRRCFIKRPSIGESISPRHVQGCSLFVSHGGGGLDRGSDHGGGRAPLPDPIFQTNDRHRTLVLGCTHFSGAGRGHTRSAAAHVSIVDSAATTAPAVLHRSCGSAHRRARRRLLARHRRRGALSRAWEALFSARPCTRGD